MKTPLSLEHLRKILAPFGLRPTSLEAIHKGTIGSNFRADTDGGRVFVRVNCGKREEDVEYEGALLWHLGARRFPTPQPLRTGSGRPFVTVVLDGPPLLVQVFPWQAGSELDDRTITAAHAGRLGELLARLHRAAADFPRHRRGLYTFERICGRLDAVRGLAAGDARLAEVIPELDQEVAWLRGARASLGNLPLGTIHGDLFPDNLLWSGDQVACALDFEQACRGQLGYDLAVTLLAGCWRDGALVDGLAWSMVTGYQRVRALTLGEREALWVQARTAALRFTVTRITDVLLPSLLPGAPPPAADKDYRDFLARLRWLREQGEGALSPSMGERPPLRAV